MKAVLTKGTTLGLLLVAAFLVYEAYAVARARARTAAVLVRAAEGELRLADVSPSRRRALLAVDDPGFARHHGLDFSTPGQGGTNLTQSLVKIFYFDRFRPGFPKIEQSLIAWLVLDPAMSKQDQLRTYLNHAYFGHYRGRRINGFAEAARTYYGRPLSALDDRQFLGLVAMLMAPRQLDPLRHTAENAERVRRIERMLAGQCQPAGLTDVSYRLC